MSLSCLLFSFTINFYKNLLRNFVFWKKKNFFSSPLDFCSLFFFLKKVFSIFQLPFQILFALVVFFFSFFYSVFCWFHLFSVCTIKKFPFKKPFEQNMGALNFFFELFWEGEYIEQKKRCKAKIIIWVFVIKSLFWENLIVYPHALRIACAIEGFLDHCCVSRRRWRGWSSQVYVHSVVIDLGRATSVASSHLSPFLCGFFSSC